MYMDEAAFSFFPYVQKTYHRKGKRCIVAHGPLRGGVQTMSMITPSGKLYFKIKRGSFISADVADFLRQMLKKFRKTKLMVIWDGARTHTSEEVKAFLSNEAKGRIHLVRLPPYSPQLNADEQVHGLIKTHDFENQLFTSLDELEEKVAQSFEALSQKPKTIARFFHHKDVAFYSE